MPSCGGEVARGALALAAACADPPPALSEAVALALVPRARRGRMAAGLRWMRTPAARDTVMWWHNGGTHGCRAFTGFVLETGAAVAAATNSPRSPDVAAVKALTSA